MEPHEIGVPCELVERACCDDELLVYRMPAGTPYPGYAFSFRRSLVSHVGKVDMLLVDGDLDVVLKPLSSFLGGPSATDGSDAVSLPLCRWLEVMEAVDCIFVRESEAEYWCDWQHNHVRSRR